MQREGWSDRMTREYTSKMMGYNERERGTNDNEGGGSVAIGVREDDNYSVLHRSYMRGYEKETRDTEGFRVICDKGVSVGALDDGSVFSRSSRCGVRATSERGRSKTVGGDAREMNRNVSGHESADEISTGRSSVASVGGAQMSVDLLRSNTQEH